MKLIAVSCGLNSGIVGTAIDKPDKPGRRCGARALSPRRRRDRRSRFSNTAKKGDEAERPRLPTAPAMRSNTGREAAGPAANKGQRQRVRDGMPVQRTRQGQRRGRRRPALALGRVHRGEEGQDALQHAHQEAEQPAEHGGQREQPAGGRIGRGDASATAAATRPRQASPSRRPSSASGAEIAAHRAGQYGAQAQVQQQCGRAGQQRRGRSGSAKACCSGAAASATANSATLPAITGGARPGTRPSVNMGST